MPTLISPIGLIAGSGQFPADFVQAARRRGLKVVAVGHRGEADPQLETLVDSCCWIRVGQLGKLISFLQRHGVRQAAFAGGISRPKLFGGLRLDWRGVRLVARLRSFMDDAVLRAVAHELESSGITVFSAAALLEESIPRGGLLTKRDLTAQELRDAQVGWQAALTLGALDIGQTVIVRDGVVVAVEAIEGTDAALRRAAFLAGAGCVVVKLAKPQQDLRFDLPTVGPQTIALMAELKYGAMVLAAGRALLLDPQRCVSAADKSGMALRVFEASAMEGLPTLSNVAD